MNELVQDSGWKGCELEEILVSLHTPTKRFASMIVSGRIIIWRLIAFYLLRRFCVSLRNCSLLSERLSSEVTAPTTCWKPAVFWLLRHTISVSNLELDAALQGSTDSSVTLLGTELIIDYFGLTAVLRGSGSKQPSPIIKYACRIVWEISRSLRIRKNYASFLAISIQPKEPFN